MPAFVTLSNLSWRKPDSTPLFTDLTLSFGPVRTGLVGRNGTGKSTLLRLIAGTLAPSSGHVTLSGKLAMMRQNLLEHPTDTIADLCGARAALALLARAEAGLLGAEELAEADWTLPARIEAALLRLGLGVEPETPLASLSGGQQSRAALAALILSGPDMLLLDEPTNNLDRDGRRAVIELLRSWTGGAIVASHDRELLAEMDAIVELTSLGATRYGGNYAAYRARKAAELDSARHDLAEAEKTRSEAARRARQASERKARKDSVGRKSRAKGGQPKMLLDAAKERSEASGGAGLRLREARRAAAEEALSAARARIEVLQPLRMELAPSGLAAGREVLRLDVVSGGYGEGAPVVKDISFEITGPERVVIAGPNGSGKTTLLRLVTGALAPRAGTVALRVPVAMLDQQLGLLDPELSLLETYRRRSPAADANAAHAALARFGFRAADALRRAGTLSGGERLRAGLACTLGATPVPMLLILDEPTNHLDLDGLEALEAALADYDGALLVVSHDDSFVAGLHPDRVIAL